MRVRPEKKPVRKPIVIFWAKGIENSHPWEPRGRLLKEWVLQGRRSRMPASRSLERASRFWVCRDALLM